MNLDVAMRMKCLTIYNDPIALIMLALLFIFIGFCIAPFVMRRSANKELQEINQDLRTALLQKKHNPDNRIEKSIESIQENNESVDDVEHADTSDSEENLSENAVGEEDDVTIAHEIRNEGGTWKEQAAKFKDETGRSEKTYARYLKM